MFRALVSRFRAATAVLAAGLHNACRPSVLVGGLLADVTRSHAELIAENALLRQQLIVASRAVKGPAFRGHERGLLVLLARFVSSSVGARVTATCTTRLEFTSMMKNANKWSAQQLREATPFGHAPMFIIRDRDNKYDAVFDRVARGVGIRVLKTAVQAP